MNKLSTSLSPYLLQHKDNPVYWYAWSEEAFDQAKLQDLPIFLSIGYAACHWCHVMAHESFEDISVANYLNEHFIAIKVDREERPDIDNIYMQAIIALHGHGGWPLSVFLTPDGKPFYGGTYFPHPAQYGQLDFLELLQHIVNFWQTNRQQLLAIVEPLNQHLQAEIKPKNSIIVPWDRLTLSVSSIMNSIDVINGGLYGSPKFPQIPFWNWLFTLGVYGKHPMLLDACYLTAKKLCQGGIYDHLGGGWMRYSTDSAWLVPHFEKMLYDNALIIEWLSKLYAYQPNSLFAERITQTIEWLCEEMLLTEGVFASSLDADSEGEEGKYYVWSHQELKQLLGNLTEPFLAYYGGEMRGNWEGVNILHRNHSQISQLTAVELASCQQKVLAARKQRSKPGRDDKVLLDWNALMITALVHASVTLCKPVWLTLAANTYSTLKRLLFINGSWLHCYRKNKSAHSAMLEDYANIITAALQLYIATGEEPYLNDAKIWQQQAEEYYTAGNHLYYQVSKKSPSLIANSQPIIDGAVPAGNGIMAINLALLHLLTANSSYQARLQLLLMTVSDTLMNERVSFYSSFCQAIAWQTLGVKIEGNFTRQTKEKLLGYISPLMILMQNNTSANFQYCNSQECFANFEQVELLRDYL
jgi:uncharacterized protein YyaL (SSP411 family)